MILEIAMYIFWVLLAIMAIIVEMHTLAQIGWAAAFAAVGALIVHAITKGDPLWVEFVTFASIWVILWMILFILFKFIKQHIHDKNDGFMSYKNKEFTATKSNKSGYGEFKDNDKVFRFKSYDNINAGDIIVVTSFRGSTAQVYRKEKKK